MSKRIVLVTANTGGGIIQFTVQLYHVLKETGFCAKVCAPIAAENTNISEVLPEDMIAYEKVKKILDKRPYRIVADRICAEKPDYILYCDDSVICLEIGLQIKEKGIKQLLTVHDAGSYHPTNQMNLRTRLVQQYNRWINRRFSGKADQYVLLSPESAKSFSRRFPERADRVLQMNLGAHIPEAPETEPAEIASLERKAYLLFFGRIDKYKGIGQLLRAYRQVEDKVMPLVIAGSGKLSEEEQAELAKTKNVLLMNRYIGDGEMKWLFAHAAAVVLPYIEATQSGMIPIAYTYGKPVIVSNLPGLTQFVDDKNTGIICADKAAWAQALQLVSDGEFNGKAEAILQYYKENMDWSKGIEMLFSGL